MLHEMLRSHCGAISLSHRTGQYFLALHTAKSATAPEPGDLRGVGKVTFPITCAPEAQSDFARGVALLHSFFYEEARRVFTSVAERDPKCAMAQWGIAMTWWHPIWTPPTPDEMRAGKAAIEKAMAMNAGSDRERGFITALNTYYNTPDSSTTAPVGQSCHGPVGPRDRVVAYEKAMRQLRDKYPDDFEVQTFYAFAVLSVGYAMPNDTSLSKQLEAAGILEKLWQQNAKSPRRRSLPDPFLRLSSACTARTRRCAELCFHRTVGAARAAYAVAHLYAFGHVG